MNYSYKCPQHGHIGFSQSMFRGVFTSVLLSMLFLCIYQPASAADKTQTAINHVATIFKNITAQYSSREYKNLNTRAAIKSGIFPKSMINPNPSNQFDLVKNTWGGFAILTYGKNPGDGKYYLALFYTGIPKDACYRMAHGGPGPLHNTQINKTRLKNNTSRQQIKALCSKAGSGATGGNKIAWGIQ